MQLGKFASGIRLQSIATAVRQRFGQRSGEVRTDLGRSDRAVLSLWMNCATSTPSTYERCIKPCQQAILSTLVSKNGGNGCKTEPKTELTESESGRITFSARSHQQDGRDVERRYELT